ncbi:MAG TPA: ABC transporter substrate-binding protein [Candidatus Binatia bacterium]|nr:ABC transporter substrate-binding protein [Candidatus Binatia bacterium]
MIVTRRSVLRGAGTAAGAALLAHGPFVNRLALGQQPIKLGALYPFTGPMALEAQEMQAATQIAIDDVNAAGGVLGRTIELVARDSEFKPEVTKRKATELLEVEKCAFLVGGLVGFEGLALAEVGCKNEVVVGFYGQNFLTVKGKMCKYQYGTNLTPYQTAASAARFVNQQGFGKRWHMLANNYSWPQMFERAFTIMAKQTGAEWTGVTWAPLGTRDFFPFLPKAAAVKADVIFVVTWAADQVACAKQIQEFGLRKQTQVIHGITELTFAEAAGKGVYEGCYSGMPWYWELRDKYPGAKAYYDKHMARRQRAPSGYAASTYATVRVLLDAARDAKTLDSDKVVRALEGRRFQYLKGPEYIRACDHVDIQEVFLCRGKAASAMRDDWDFFEIVQAVGGEESAESCESEGFDPKKRLSEQI